MRIARTPLTLLLLLGILCYGAYWGYKNVLAEVPPPPPTPCVDQTVQGGQLKSAQVTVSIFNGGDRKGLAGDVGRALRQRGFKVMKTTNTAEKIQQTVIVGADANSPEVLFVKTFFKNATARGDKRADHSVDILVGNKYGGFNSKAKTTYAVKSTTVCLPQQASPSSQLGG
ncbi:MAG TPA: LytR C-terminal domain-containing protein [Microlunatus sp.]|nr:LytR C-terminal domain-containing protein [Microlunatus sp.]